MPTATDLVTDLPADFEVFGQAVATSMADLLGGTTGQILSKTTNADMDFTWINNDQGDITGVTAGTGISGGGTSGTVTVTNSMATAIDAKGDLIGGTGADTFARLAVGTNGQVLTADSAEATGLKWATPVSGGMTLLSTTPITATNTITVSSISTAYTELLIAVENFGLSGAETLSIRFNSDSGSNYDQFLYQANYGAIANSHPSTEIMFGNINNIKASNNALVALRIPLYSSTTAYKTGMGSLSALYGTGTNIFTAHGTFAYKNTSAITSVTILSGSVNFAAQGNIKIWGIN